MRTVRAKQLSERGFTLVELMAVMLIVAILAAIAIPTYRNQIRTTNRSDAMGVLQAGAQAMERYFAQRGNYTGATLGTAAGAIFPNQAPIEGIARYNLAVVSNANTFTLTATPVAGSVQDGDGILQITNTGRRGWDRNGDGDTDDPGENTWRN